MRLLACPPLPAGRAAPLFLSCEIDSHGRLSPRYDDLAMTTPLDLRTMEVGAINKLLRNWPDLSTWTDGRLPSEPNSGEPDSMGTSKADSRPRELRPDAILGDVGKVIPFAAGHSNASLVGASGQSGLATAMTHNLKVAIHGNVGAFFAMLNAGGDFEIHGDAASACGHSMTEGGILVRGHAGASLGAFAVGGFIAVHGSAKEYCGLCLNGGDVVVRQSVGMRAAFRMREGNLVLGNDAGNDLGAEAIGGTIYLRGEARSLAPHVREVRMRESDAVRLGLLLVRAGIKGVTKDFRVFRPRKSHEG